MFYKINKVIEKVNYPLKIHRKQFSSQNTHGSRILLRIPVNELQVLTSLSIPNVRKLISLLYEIS